MKLWCVATGEMVLSFTQKNQSAWKLDWTTDEVYCARLVGNEVQIYESRDFGSGIISSKVFYETQDLPNGSNSRESTAFLSLPERQRAARSLHLCQSERASLPASVSTRSLASWTNPLHKKHFFAQIQPSIIGTPSERPFSCSPTRKWTRRASRTTARPAYISSRVLVNLIVEWSSIVPVCTCLSLSLFDILSRRPRARCCLVAKFQRVCRVLWHHAEQDHAL